MAARFAAHWAAANAALGAQGPISLQGGQVVGDLAALRLKLEEQRADVENRRNGVEGQRVDFFSQKAGLLRRLNQFNGKLRSLAEGSRWTEVLPKVFSVSEGLGPVLRPLDGMQYLWEEYEAAEGAFALMGGYSRAEFTTELAALKTAAAGLTRAELALDLARAVRGETEREIYAVLKAYRARIPAEFPPKSAILTTLPALTLERGPKPAAVQAAGRWDAAAGAAELTWSQVRDKSVVAVEIRATAGPVYAAKDERVLARLPADGPRVWQGTFGLEVPGAEAAFQVYTLKAAGHERGSRPVVVQRPAD